MSVSTRIPESEICSAQQVTHSTALVVKCGRLKRNFFNFKIYAYFFKQLLSCQNTNTMLFRAP